MYFWTASYPHGAVQGSGLQDTGAGCYIKNYRKIYFRSANGAYPGCDGGDGNTTVLWDNGQKTTWASGLTSKNSDKPSERPHCNTNINFMKFWHLVGKGFRLPDYYTETGTSCNTASSTNGCDKPLYVSLCFSGFMCEATQVEFQYRVYKGCPQGYYEDTTIAWPKTTSGGASNPDYCLKCPPGQYQDFRNSKKGSPDVCKKCPAGKFGDESNHPNRDVAAYCANCPAGRYGTSTGSTDPLCTGQCTAGYYCPVGNNTKPDNPTYMVKAGFFGSAGATTDEGTSECPAGYYCGVGTANTVCGAGGVGPPANCRHRCGDIFPASETEKVFCPARSATYTLVSPGNYAAGIGDPDHPKLTRDQEKPCKPPNYCPGGVVGNGQEKPCPKGKCGASPGLQNDACDGDCAAGFYCTEGSDQNDENRCGRDKDYPAAWFCPPGVGAPTEVGANKTTFVLRQSKRCELSRRQQDIVQPRSKTL
jgi:hypothetical protein